MPKEHEIPSVAVGCAADSADEVLHHNRTVSAGKELYTHSWGSGHHHQTASSGAGEQELARSKKVKEVKMRHVPGRERYERNPYEPIKVP